MISIQISGNTIEYGHESTQITSSPSDCSFLFDNKSLLLSQTAICAWNIQNTGLTIYLSPNSLIQMDDSLTFKEGAWDYRLLGDTFSLKEAITISSIAFPTIPPQPPTIVFNGPSSIGICDDLASLDALSSTGFGKAQPLFFLVLPKDVAFPFP